MLQLLFAVSIAEESVIANAVESTGENVEEESPDELLRREGHGFLLIVVTIVPPLELHFPSSISSSRWLEIATRWV